MYIYMVYIYIYTYIYIISYHIIISYSITFPYHIHRCCENCSCFKGNKRYQQILEKRLSMDTKSYIKYWNTTSPNSDGWRVNYADNIIIHIYIYIYLLVASCSNSLWGDPGRPLRHRPKANGTLNLFGLALCQQSLADLSKFFNLNSAAKKGPWYLL